MQPIQRGRHACSQNHVGRMEDLKQPITHLRRGPFEQEHGQDPCPCPKSVKGHGPSVPTGSRAFSYAFSILPGPLDSCRWGHCTAYTRDLQLSCIFSSWSLFFTLYVVSSRGFTGVRRRQSPGVVLRAVRRARAMCLRTTHRTFFGGCREKEEAYSAPIQGALLKDTQRA